MRPCPATPTRKYELCPPILVCILQIALVRALKEQHIAERQVVLKSALQDDLDADLKQAAELPPLPGAGSGGPPVPAPGLPALLPACPHVCPLFGCLPACPHCFPA
jgi:hypothetical protein